MTGQRRLGIIAIYVLGPLLLAIVFGADGTGNARIKRQVGGSACMQIYSVPRQSVQCEPTDEVRRSLDDLNKTLEKQNSYISNVKARVDKMDPEKPRKLPEEIIQRLDAIDKVKQMQFGHSEYLKRLESDIENVQRKTAEIQTSDRQEIARLIQMQMTLVELTLKQANVTIHDAYIRSLTENTAHLTDRLRQLEANLKELLQGEKVKLVHDIEHKAKQAQFDLKKVEDDITAKSNELQVKLYAQAVQGMKINNRTISNEKKLDELIHNVRYLTERQQRYDYMERKSRSRIDELFALVAALKTQTEMQEGKILRMEIELSNASKNLTLALNTSGQCQQQIRELQTEVQEMSAITRRWDHLLPKAMRVADCQDVLTFYHPASGVYNIRPSPFVEPFEVYCEMNQNGGWTVFQRRKDGGVDFFRNWKEYQEGFGNLSGEFWLGLKRLHSLTSNRNYTLRIDMQDWDGKWWFAGYKYFSIESEAANYKLHVDGYYGNAGDSLRYHNEMEFSATDKNHDKNYGICAKWCHGAFWYKDCFHANLNGRYYTQGPYTTNTGWGDGVVWRHLRGTNYYSLKSVEMKIKQRETKT